jgi:hypothetical protein
VTHHGVRTWRTSYWRRRHTTTWTWRRTRGPRLWRGLLVIWLKTKIIAYSFTRTIDDEIWEARVCMSVFSTLLPRSNENKSCMRVDESWEARVCMRVFSTLVPRSNENKSCMRVDESVISVIKIWTGSKHCFLASHACFPKVDKSGNIVS